MTDLDMKVTLKRKIKIMMNKAAEVEPHDKYTV